MTPGKTPEDEGPSDTVTLPDAYTAASEFATSRAFGGDGLTLPWRSDPALSKTYPLMFPPTSLMERGAAPSKPFLRLPGDGSFGFKYGLLKEFPGPGGTPDPASPPPSLEGVQQRVTEALRNSKAGRACAIKLAEEGTVSLRILRCHNLKRIETRGYWGRWQMPFVIARIGDEERRTPTIAETLNPVWRAGNEFSFKLKSSERNLDLKVMNENYGQTDEFGTTAFPIWDLSAGVWHRHRAPLEGGESGELEFEIRIDWVPKNELREYLMSAPRSSPSPKRSTPMAEASGPSEKLPANRVASSRRRTNRFRGRQMRLPKAFLEAYATKRGAALSADPSQSADKRARQETKTKSPKPKNRTMALPSDMLPGPFASLASDDWMEDLVAAAALTAQDVDSSPPYRSNAQMLAALAEAFASAGSGADAPLTGQPGKRSSPRRSRASSDRSEPKDAAAGRSASSGRSTTSAVPKETSSQKPLGRSGTATLGDCDATAVALFSPSAPTDSASATVSACAGARAASSEATDAQEALPSCRVGSPRRSTDCDGSASSGNAAPGICTGSGPARVAASDESTMQQGAQPVGTATPGTFGAPTVPDPSRSSVSDGVQTVASAKPAPKASASQLHDALEPVESLLAATRVGFSSKKSTLQTTETLSSLLGSLAFASSSSGADSSTSGQPGKDLSGADSSTSGQQGKGLSPGKSRSSGDGSEPQDTTAGASASSGSATTSAVPKDCSSQQPLQHSGTAKPGECGATAVVSSSPSAPTDGALGIVGCPT